MVDFENGYKDWDEGADMPKEDPEEIPAKVDVGGYETAKDAHDDDDHKSNHDDDDGGDSGDSGRDEVVNGNKKATLVSDTTLVSSLSKIDGEYNPGEDSADDEDEVP